MAKVYRAAVIGTSRMGAFIDNEIPLVEVTPGDARLSDGPVGSHDCRIVPPDSPLSWPWLTVPLRLPPPAPQPPPPTRARRSHVLVFRSQVSTLGTPMALFSAKTLPMGHSGAYTVCERTELVAGCDLRQEVLEKWSPFYDVPLSHCYTDYKEMLEKEQPDIVSVCTQVRCHRPPIEPLTDPNVPLTNRPLYLTQIYPKIDPNDHSHATN